MRALTKPPPGSVPRKDRAAPHKTVVRSFWFVKECVLPGDDALIEAINVHWTPVYRFVYCAVGDVHDAEDLTQEVFVRVFRSLATYTPGTFEGWLHRITTNLFLDGARRRQRIRFEGLGDDVEQRIPGTEQSPAQAWDDNHLDGDIQAALQALPPDYRAAVVLCDIEGFSYEEIAATMGVKLGTVRSRIHRGRAQLRAALAHRDRDRRVRER